MNPLKIAGCARLRALVTAGALTCAVFATTAGACPPADQQIDDAFAVAEGADLSYLPFTLGESQDEHASLAGRAPAEAPAIASDEPIVLAGSFEFD